MNFGLSGTSIATGLLLAVVLAFQFKAKAYIPGLYWLTVALISVFGTLVTDNLTDSIGVSLELSTIIFSLLLGATFVVWYLQEKTLSIHSILTRRREAFYWLTVLFTFALGTAAGDLLAEGLALGYSVTGFIIAGLITLVAASWKFKLHPVLSFWLIYIFTRPLGASIGDYLSQPSEHGGLGLGATATSAIFLFAIAAIVTYLTRTKKDVIVKNWDIKEPALEQKNGLWQTVGVVTVLLIVGVTGYNMRQASLLEHEASSTATSSAVLGNLSTFRTISQDTLDKLNAGDQSGATERVKNLESEWDTSQSTLKSKNITRWKLLDHKIDTVLTELRAKNPNQASEKSALEDLLASLN